MSDELIVVDVEQGSDDWRALRQIKRPASITPMVMGTSKFQDLGDAYDAMVGDSTFTGNAATDYGTRTEPRARELLSQILGVKGTSKVGYRGEYLASLDFIGVTNEGKTVVFDIKCPFSGVKSSTYREATKGKIEPGYADQLEHQFRVFRPDLIGLFVYIDDDTYELVYYTPSDKRWQIIQNAWELFWEVHVAKFERPEVFDRRDDDKWKKAASDFWIAKAELDAADGKLELARKALIKLADGRKSEGCGVRVNIFPQRGSVDYKAALQSVAPELDVEPFRKPPITKTQVTTTEEKKS